MWKSAYFMYSIEIQEECMKDLLIKLYEAHRAQNIRSIDSVAAEAKNEIDNYWTIWKNLVAMRQDLDILVVQRN